MNMRQVARMLLYRWKLCAVVFMMVFASVLLAQYNIIKTRLQPKYVSTTVFLCYYPSEVVSVDGETTTILSSVENPIHYRYILSSILNEADIKNVVGNNSVQIDTIGSLLTLKIIGENAERAQMLNELLIEKFTTLPYDTGIIKVFYQVPQAAEFQSTRGSLLNLIYMLLIAFTLAVLCALGAVFARENLDKTIRSVHHLKKTADIPVLPCLSPKPAESELMALARRFNDGGVFVLAGVRHETSVLDLACRLADTLDREDFSVIVVNLSGALTPKKSGVTDLWQGKPGGYFLSGKFKAELDKLQEKYRLVLLVTPPVSELSTAVALAKTARIVYIIRFGKDNDEELQSAVSYLRDCPDTLAGVVITGYKSNVEYIWEG